MFAKYNLTDQELIALLQACDVASFRIRDIKKLRSYLKSTSCTIPHKTGLCNASKKGFGSQLTNENVKSRKQCWVAGW